MGLDELQLILTICLFFTATLHAAESANQCSSKDDYEMPRTCLDLWCRGSRLSGVYKVYPDGTDLFSIDVFCDQNTDGGGWTVFQRRMDGWVDFYRNWMSYKLGFGDVSGEHWLGNDKLNMLLGMRHNELRVDLEAFSNERVYAKYSNFSVGTESTNYKLQLSGYSGTAGEDMIYHGNGRGFSTYDRDNDISTSTNCASLYHGAWWYGNCHSANLNGNYHNGAHKSFADGVNWYHFKTHQESLKTAEMKFRAIR